MKKVVRLLAEAHLLVATRLSNFLREVKGRRRQYNQRCSWPFSNLPDMMSTVLLYACDSPAPDKLPGAISRTQMRDAHPLNPHPT
jgi:hypothetical protein